MIFGSGSRSDKRRRNFYGYGAFNLTGSITGNNPQDTLSGIQGGKEGGIIFCVQESYGTVRTDTPFVYNFLAMYGITILVICQSGHLNS